MMKAGVLCLSLSLSLYLCLSLSSFFLSCIFPCFGPMLTYERESYRRRGRSEYDGQAGAFGWHGIGSWGARGPRMRSRPSAHRLGWLEKRLGIPLAARLLLFCRSQASAWRVDTGRWPACSLHYRYL